MQTWYETKSYGNEIKKVSVISGTKQTITLSSGSRQHKKSNWTSYFRTQEEAIKFKLDGYREDVLNQQRFLNEAKQELKEAEAYYKKLRKSKGAKP